MNNYLSLMEKVLTGMIYEDKPCDFWSGGVYKSELRELGMDWPSVAHTMVGRKRLHQLRVACQDCINESIEGDFVECGVWRGGAAIMMRAVSEELKGLWKPRTVWAYDSFSGLPLPQHQQDKGDQHHTYDALSVSLDEVAGNFAKYGFGTDDPYHRLVQGWFNVTLPKAEVEKIAVLRVDCDMYQSTLDVLENLYHKVSSGGFVIIDDYQLQNCRIAVHEFREKQNITEEIKEIDNMGVYWRVDHGR